MTTPAHTVHSVYISSTAGLAANHIVVDYYKL
jgi:hypothetical protein